MPTGNYPLRAWRRRSPARSSTIFSAKSWEWSRQPGRVTAQRAGAVLPAADGIDWDSVRTIGKGIEAAYEIIRFSFPGREDEIFWHEDTLGARSSWRAPECGGRARLAAAAGRGHSGAHHQHAEPRPPFVARSRGSGFAVMPQHHRPVLTAHVPPLGRQRACWLHHHIMLLRTNARSLP
jgi:hypothetical protein